MSPVRSIRAISRRIASPSFWSSMAVSSSGRMAQWSRLNAGIIPTSSFNYFDCNRRHLASQGMINVVSLIRAYICYTFYLVYGTELALY